MKPVIGITSYIRKDVFRNYSQVGYEYIDKIEKANGIPIILPLLQKYSEEELNRLIEDVDGIIFTGGCNVKSNWYGEKSLEKEAKEDDLRNKFERDLFLVAKKKKKPILGVCRGCQLINVLQGEDGVIEGVEYEGDFYMAGVQWHPEGMEDQLRLFQEFVEICSQN